jgi:hypothetical protein
MKIAIDMIPVFRRIPIISTAASNNSLDRSGGSVLRINLGAAKVA